MKSHFLKDSIKKIQQFKSTELVQQQVSKLVAPRTTIQPLVFEDSSQQKASRKKASTLEQFNIFTSQILPKMQETIELDLLHQQFSNIKDTKIQEQISQAYLRRQVLLYKQSQEQTPFEDIKDILSSSPKETTDVVAQVDILKHNEEDVGKYSIFTLQDLQKYYKNQYYGDYIQQEFRYTKKLAVMCTEESLKIVNDLRKIRPSKQNYLSQSFVEQWEDEEVYPLIFQQLSQAFIVELQKMRSSEKLHRLFATSAVFDKIIQVISYEQKVNSQFNQILNSHLSTVMNQIVQQIEQKADSQLCNSQLPNEFLRDLKFFEIVIENQSFTINLEQYTESQLAEKLIPQTMKYGRICNFEGFNSGILCYGERGTGKSGVLSYVSMWAFKNNWIVISVPNVQKWTQEICEIERHNQSGLYLQNDYAVELLDQIASANQENFEKIQVNKELYGKFNLSGVHENDVDPVPNSYDKERKVYFKEHEKFLFEDELKYQEEEDREFNVKLQEKLPDPKNLMEIAQYGIQNKLFATNAIYELLEQLYNLESHCVLIAIDGYNWFFRPSTHPSFRYANDRKLKGCIPPYHLALCRAFIQFDGHKIKNGFKICASSNKQLYKHTFNPEKIMFPTGYDVRLNGLPLDDYKNMMEYYYQNKIWLPTEQEKYSYEQYWMENQGNWHETFKVMTSQMRAL